MGRTLYLGSLKSDVYFCIYEKDYEQYVKFGIPLEEADIINRFEIRLRNERAYYAVRDLLTYYDAEQTAFSIINQYVRFVDEEPDKRKNDWKLNDRWGWFIGDNRQSLKLTTKPEPYPVGRGRGTAAAGRAGRCCIRNRPASLRRFFRQLFQRDLFKRAAVYRAV